ncbi:MAG: polyprenyl synthetase family protein [Anaerolineales bacterium]
MSLKRFNEEMLPAIEDELQKQVARLNEPRTRPFYEMLTYHMGWTGEGAGKQAMGKRIRPLMTLLAAASRGADWRNSAPAAAAIELVHNFSLIHDDVQDDSERRRGRLTVWKIWGAPMAINAGDALFVLAQQAMTDLKKSYSAKVTLRAASILHDVCLDLTRGQYLDMSYEQRSDLAAEDYYPMIGGKTSALLSACTQIGAALGGATAAQQEAYRLFGYHLGMAFQIQDDVLGIWGDEALTGKSAVSDLVEGKNSLPIIYGVRRGGAFAQRWRQGKVSAAEASALARQLESEGAKAYAEQAAAQETEQALRYLDKSKPQGEAGAALLELANALLGRAQ